MKAGDGVRRRSPGRLPRTMSRGRPAAMLAGLVAWTAGSAPLAVAAASLQSAPAGRVNFVLVLCDDLGYGDLGCYGHPAIRTPHLDRLAADGLRLTDCYAAAPVCSPSRAGILCGQVPQRLGIVDWIPPESDAHLPRGTHGVAALLARHGYQTCHTGKWHLCGRFNEPVHPQPDDHGFDHWLATQNNAIPSHLNPRNFVRNGRPLGPQQVHSSQLIVDEAIAWLRRRDPDRPFYLNVWFHAPHEPVATPADVVERYRPLAANDDQAQYFGNVEHLDAQLGRLLAALDELLLSDSTLVFFTSDNGPETLLRYPKARRSYGRPGSLRGMKLHLYEGGIRVPGIVRWPGRVAAGRTSDEPVSGVDWLPTVAELAGLAAPDGPCDGESFAPLLRGERWTSSRPLYWQYDRAISRPKVAVRQGRWKLLADEALARFELYDLRDDPAESRDLADDQPQRVDRLASTMRELHEQIEAQRRANAAAADKASTADRPQ